MHVPIYCGTIPHSQDKEFIGLSTDEWIKMCYVCIVEYFSIVMKNKFLSFAREWMNLETIVFDARFRKINFCMFSQIYIDSEKDDKKIEGRLLLGKRKE